MMTKLPGSFLTRPIAHRALHDITQGRPENGLAAIRAAITHGYGIEIDLQLSRDDQAMVFHDYHLGRLTAENGPVRQRTAQELGQIALSHGDGECIPTLQQVLDLVDGQVPLLIELKDQDGAMGTDLGPLERATAQALNSYRGDVAVMSFNPHAVALMAEHAPQICRGLTTCHYNAQDWGTLPEARRDHLRQIADFDRVQASFISHNVTDLDNPRVQELHHAGVPVLCWTVRSAAQQTEAEKTAQNITFEQYLP